MTSSGSARPRRCTSTPCSSRRSDPLSGTLLSFATLGIGFAVRPLGGIIGGYLGDKIGRKPVLVGSLFLMGFATVLIGVLPTYQMVGIWAPILLVIVRVVQGLAFGAEWGGAILMVFEHAPWRKRGLYTGITQAGFPVGLLLANLAFLASVPLGDQWAWRVPFLLSAVLIVVGIIIRLKIDESPEFEELKEEGQLSKNPILEVLRDDWRNVLRAFCLRVAETAGYAVSVTFMLSYLTREELADRSTTLTALMLAAAIGIFATVCWGALTDRVGRRPVYVLGTVLTLLWGVPLFLTVNTGAHWRSSSPSSSATPSARTPSPACRAHGSRSCSRPRPAPAVPRCRISSRPSSPALRR